MRPLLFRSIIASALLLMSCAGSGSGTDSKETMSSRTIIIGGSGGVSGAANATEIRADGAVRRYLQMPGKEKIYTDLFTTSADTVAFLFRYLDEAGFRKTEFSTPGNMTFFITLEDGEDSHTVKWGNPDVTPPAELAGFHVLASRFVQNHTTKN